MIGNLPILATQGLVPGSKKYEVPYVEAVAMEANEHELVDVEDDDDRMSGGESSPLAPVKGSLNKWTNYIHGWQARYFELQDGVLVYYKSANDTSFGCRGSVAIGRAVVSMNESDDCRFDIAANDSVWYLRADFPQERQRWLEALEAYKTDSGFGSQIDLHRHGSMASLQSTKSVTSSNSSGKTTQALKEKLAELHTYRDIVTRQVDSLQVYFDACTIGSDQRTQAQIANCAAKRPSNSADMFSTLESVPDTTQPAALNPLTDSTGVDFKGEALTFKATTGAIITALDHCIEIMHQREENWRKRLEKELERRKRLSEQYRVCTSEMRRMHAQRPPATFSGPDFEEGPNSALNEEEWHDAVDAALDQIDFEDERLCRIMGREASATAIASPSADGVLLSSAHPLYNEIDRLTMEQLCYAKAGVEEGVWQLFADEGEMKMYKRDLEIDGMVCDPLKAVHSVKGVSAREYLHYFFDPGYKLDWDTTLDSMRVVEKLSTDTSVLHQVHKRVWPAAQRESLFWSHFRRVNSHKDPDASDLYIVCNHDLERPDVPLSHKGSVRVGLTIAMICQTVVKKSPSKVQFAELSRDDIYCKIIYVAQVNPGGWAPNSALRLVYKREYPRFLKRFTQYVEQKVQHKPLTM